MLVLSVALLLIQIVPESCRNIVTLTGVEFSSGAHRDGPERTYQHLKALGIEVQLKAMGWKVQDPLIIREENRSDDDTYQNLHIPRLLKGLKALQERTLVSPDETFLLNIGGDHSMSLGPISGFWQRTQNRAKRPLVIWFDQHSDKYFTKYMRQFLHGTVVDQLVGSGDRRLSADLKIQTPMDLSHFMFVGTMSGDEDSLRDAGATVLAADEVQRTGLARAKQRLRSRIEQSDEVWLSYDFDVIAMDHMNAVNHPGPLGLMPEESSELLREIGGSGKVVGADFVEFVPSKDVDGKQTRLALSQIYAFMKARSQKSNFKLPN